MTNSACLQRSCLLCIAVSRSTVYPVSLAYCMQLEKFGIPVKALYAKRQVPISAQRKRLEQQRRVALKRCFSTMQQQRWPPTNHPLTRLCVLLAALTSAPIAHGTMYHSTRRFRINPAAETHQSKCRPLLLRRSVPVPWASFVHPRALVQWGQEIKCVCVMITLAVAQTLPHWVCNAQSHAAGSGRVAARLVSARPRLEP